jgi:hypothetical protein
LETRQEAASCLAQFLPEFAGVKSPNGAAEPSEKDYCDSLNDRFGDPHERFATIPFDEITLDTTPAYVAAKWVATIWTANIASISSLARIR